MKKLFAGIFLAASALMLSSCIVAVIDTSDPASLRGWGEFRRSVPFAEGGTIILENNRGDVEIYGWERDEVEIVARPAARTFKPGFYWFSYPGWYGPQPSVSVDRFDDLLKIRPEDEEQGGAGLTMTLHVPMSVNFSSLRSREGNILLSGIYGKTVIDLRQGDIRVENYSGSLDLSLGRGRVEAELLDLRRGDDIKITVTSGDILVLLEQDVSAQVEASAPLKRVESEFDLGPKLPAAKVSGKVKDGLAQISLAAAQGLIELKKIKK